MRSPKGRGAQMNRGAARAAGEVLLFLHADTRLPERAFESIMETSRDGRFAGGAFDLSIDNPRPIFRLTAFLASVKHRITRVPYGDQAIFLRGDYFREIGGYPEIPLFEDVEIMEKVRRRGGRIRIIRDRVSTSSRKWEKDGVGRAILRNMALQLLHYFGVPPERLVRYYYREGEG